MAQAGKVPRSEQDLQRLKQAVAKEPGNSRLHAELGKALSRAGDFEGAKRHYRMAVAIDPTLIDAQLNLGDILLRDCDIGGALACFGMRQVFAPEDWLRLKMALVLPPIVESTDHIKVLRARTEQALRVLSKDDLRIENPSLDGGRLFYLAYYGFNDRSHYEALARLYLKANPSLGMVAPHCVHPRSREDEPRIKVAFVSAFLFDHSIGRLNRSLIANLDRDWFHVTVAIVPNITDKVTKEITESADRAIRVTLNLEEARRALAAEKFDVVVYPEIGMDPFTYCLAFARLAPVQCTTWGHPVTTGIPTMNYFVSGADMEPEDADEHYSETLIRLDTLTTQYRKPELSERPKARSAFGLDEEAHYYLVAQYLFKTHPDFDLILGEILRRDPEGRVLLIHGARRAWSEILMARFKRAMPEEAERIQFIDRQSQKDFLALIAAVDVSLDIPQFNGGNTTIEALTVGTPVVTMPTALARGRLCSAIYKHIGVTDCIAETPDDYVDLAIRLATKPSFRKKIVEKILKNNDRLFENEKAISEWERFFLEACENKGLLVSAVQS